MIGQTKKTNLQLVIDACKTLGIITANAANTKAIKTLAPNEAKNQNNLRQRVSSWLNKEEKSNPPQDICEEITRRYYLPSDIWERDDLDEALIRTYLERYLTIHDTYRNISSNLKKKFPNILPDLLFSKEEEEHINSIENASSCEEISTLFDFNTNDTIGYFLQHNQPSQEFLEALFDILYDKNCHVIIDTFLIDKIVTTNKRLLIRMAHSLGSAEKFEKAVQILNQVIEQYDIMQDQDDIELYDIHTSLISNLLRHWNSRNIEKVRHNTLSDTEKEQLKELIESYKKLFDLTKHYYPGINYAYIVTIIEKLELLDGIKYHTAVSDIQQESKESINKDNSYWAKISDMEFDALQDKFDINKFNDMIKNTKPTKDQLARTLRQIVFFNDILEAGGNPLEKSYKVHNLKKAIHKLLLF